MKILSRNYAYTFFLMMTYCFSANAMDRRDLDPKLVKVTSFDSNKITVIYHQKKYILNRDEFDKEDLRPNKTLSVSFDKKAWTQLK